MKFAVGYFPTDEGIEPATLARMVEERPFESLFFTDHTHIPASRETPYPAGTELPWEYSHIHDPFVALMAAGAVTERIKLGTGICLVVERDPIVTAKAAASVDRLTGGRLLFGVGAGWNLEEMRNHGTDPALRFRIMRERVEAIKEIWTADEATYHGEHVDFERIWCWPKPVADPHPPIIVGGHGKHVLERVLAYGDEWMPNRIGDDEKISARIARLRKAGEDAGPRADPDDARQRDDRAGRARALRVAGRPPGAVLAAQGDEADAERRLDRIAAGIEAYERAG